MRFKRLALVLAFTILINVCLTIVSLAEIDPEPWAPMKHTRSVN
jgi:hypothetical protein